MNKKMIRWMLALIALVMASISVGAALGEAGLNPIEGFFGGGWQTYERTITFLVFFFLFFTAFIIGMKKSMGDLSRAHLTFAFTAAFLSSFIIVMTMGFSWMNLSYLAWILIGILILFALYAMLGKMGMENKKLLAFIIALIITLLLLWLIWYLMHEGLPFQGLGKVTDAFSGFGKSSSSKKRSWFTFSKPSRGGGDPVSAIPQTPGQADGPPIIGDEDDPDTEEVRQKSKVKWWMILAAFAVVSAVTYGAYKARKIPKQTAESVSDATRNKTGRFRLGRLINNTQSILKNKHISPEEKRQVQRNLDEASKIVEQLRSANERRREKYQEKKNQINSQNED